MPKIEIKNYRSFSIDNPVTLDIQEGITFLLGPNNIGKSNLLKLFHELKPVVNHNTIKKGQYSFPNSGPSWNDQIPNQKSGIEDVFITIVDEDKTNKLIIGNHGRLAIKNGNDSGSDLIDKREFGIVENVFSNSMYIGSFRASNSNSSGTYYDIKIGIDFITEWDQWANGDVTIKRKKIKLLVEEIKDILDFENINIDVKRDKKSLIITNENGSFLLEELGDGISHIILILGNTLFQQPDFILIDEPENGLHPKMQQVFISALASKARLGLIATSHSIGLARSTADHIFSLIRNSATNKIKILPFGENYSPTLTNSLSEMSYSQFVELGGNHILLVEGRTDIKSFREILRKYNIEHHFIILDLGGSNMINVDSREELMEIKRLNAKSYTLIFDSDREEEGQNLKPEYQDFKNLCEDLGFNVFATDRHSTDNYITQEAINLVIGNNYPVLGEFESLESQERKNSNTKWSKSQNWKMFRAMNKDDFNGTELNEFITETMSPIVAEE